jgi:hypothetical protein
MTKAIQQIVDAYVRLNNRQALEDPKMHRRRLAVDLKDCATRSGKHYRPRHLNAQLSELDRLRARSGKHNNRPGNRGGYLVGKERAFRTIEAAN